MTINNDSFRFRRTTGDNLQPQAVTPQKMSITNIFFSAQETVTGTIPASALAPKTGPGSAAITSSLVSRSGGTLGLLGYEIFMWEGLVTDLNHTIPQGQSVDASDWNVIGPFVVPSISYELDGQEDFGSSRTRINVRTWLINNSGVSKDVTIIIRYRYMITYGGYGSAV